MTTTPMSAELQRKADHAMRCGYDGVKLTHAEAHWLLHQAARAEVLRAEVDAWRAGKLRLVGKDGEFGVVVSMDVVHVQAATDALEKETGHVG